MELIAEILTMILEHMVLHHICEKIEHFVVQLIKKVKRRSKQ